MIRNSFLFALLFMLALTGQASADQAKPIKYNRENRFAVIRTDDGSSTKNVEIKLMHTEDVPQYLFHQATLIAKQCTESFTNADTVLFYSYTSNHNRKNKLPPNYILDFKEWKELSFKTCNYPTPCEKGSCILMGYSARGPEVWHNTFTVKSLQWDTVKQRAPNHSTETYLRNQSVADGSCVQLSGILSEDGRACTMAYGWNRDGLATIKAQSN